MNKIIRAAYKLWARITGNQLYNPDYIDFIIKAREEFDREATESMWDEVDTIGSDTYGDINDEYEDEPDYDEEIDPEKRRCNRCGELLSEHDDLLCDGLGG